MQLRVGANPPLKSSQQHGKASLIAPVSHTPRHHKQQRCVVVNYKVVENEGPLLPSLESMLETPANEAPPPSPVMEPPPPPPPAAEAAPAPAPTAEAPATAVEAPSAPVEALAQPPPPPQPPAAPAMEMPQAEAPPVAPSAAEPSLPAIDTSTATEGLNDVMGEASMQASELQGSLDTSLSGLKDATAGLGEEVGGGLSSAREGVSQALEDSSAALSSLLGSASEATEGLTSTVDSTSKAALEAIDQAAAQAQALADQLAAAADAQRKGVTSAVDQAAAELASTTSTYLQGVEQTLDVYRDQVWQSLPPEAQGVLVQVGDVAGEGASFAAANPTQASIIGGLIIGPVAVTAYNNRYGGYAGELDPSEVQALLSEENSNALLVDIRSDEARGKDGVLELKFDARFKAVALPLRYAQAQVDSISNSVLRQVSSKEQLVVSVHAAFVANLSKIETPMCKVVVMDKKGGEKARTLARALRQEGLVNAYVMGGGFSKWVKNGLPVETTKADYEAGQIDVLNDNLEVVAARAAKLATRLQDPKVALPVGSTTAALSVALYNYHTTLEVIGLLGLCASLYTKLDEYDSPQDAAADAARSLRQLASSLRGAAAGSSSEPSTSAAAAAAPSQGRQRKGSRMQDFKPVPKAPLPPPPQPPSEQDLAAAVAAAAAASAPEMPPMQPSSNDSPASQPAPPAPQPSPAPMQASQPSSAAATTTTSSPSSSSASSSSNGTSQQ